MGNISVYAALASDKKKGNEQHIFIKILSNRTLIKRVPTKIYIRPEYWDAPNRMVKTSYSLASAYNQKIERAVSEIRQLLYNTPSIENYTKDAVLELLKGKKSDSVVKFMTDHIDAMEAESKERRYSLNTVKKWRGELARLKGYDPNVMFSQINDQWLERYEAHCAKSLVKGTSLAVTMRKLFEILRKASRRKLFDMSKIEGYKRPMYKHPERPYLTIEQVDTIWNNLQAGDYNNEEGMQTIIAFFLVECLSGIRFSDWGKFTVEKLIDTEALKVRTTKTKEPIYLPLNKSPRLAGVIEYIRQNGIKFDFTEQYTNRMLKAVGGRLKLPFPLTTHVGRHTAATLFLNIGYSTEAVAHILGVSLSTAQIYGKITRVRITREYNELGGL